jgi:hypothetical protein
MRPIIFTLPLLPLLLACGMSTSPTSSGREVGVDERQVEIRY